MTNFDRQTGEIHDEKSNFNQPNQPYERGSNNDDELQEGKLYVYQDGELKEIERDPDDTLKKVRIMEEAITSATKVQKQLRKQLAGYKPDLSLVCSALIIAKASEDDATQAVVKLFSDITRKLAES